MPDNFSRIRGKKADNRFQQSGLAGAIRSFNAEHLARVTRSITGSSPYRFVRFLTLSGDTGFWQFGNSAERMEHQPQSRAFVENDIVLERIGACHIVIIHRS
jgi:hypothetical protein